MTNAPGGPSQHPGTDSFFDSLRRIDLRRGPDRWAGGVSTGIAHRFGLDPLVIRAGFVVASIFFGFGIAAYLWIWLLVPDQDERTHLEQGLRDGRGESILLLVVTGLATVGILPWWGGPGYWGGGWWAAFALFTVAVGVGIGITVHQVRTSGNATPPPRGGTGSSGYAGATGQTGAAGFAGTTGSSGGAGYGGAAGHGRTGSLAYGWAGQQDTDSGAARPAGSPPRQGQDRPPAPPRPAAPPRPIRERRGTGGVVVGLIATGLVMLAFGGLLWVGAEYELPGNDVAVAFAGALAVLALLLLGLGVAGRRGGWPGFLAVVLLFGTVAFAPLPDQYELSTRVGQDVWRPDTVTEDSRFVLGIGEGTLDLGGLDPADLDGQTLAVDVNIGHLRIWVPEDITVRVEAGSALGAVNLNGIEPYVDRGMSVTGGMNVTEDLVVGDGPVDLVIDAQVGIGQVSVERN